MSIEAPYLPDDAVRSKAREFLEKHHPSLSIPIPVEQIVEFRLGLEIVPLPGLRETFDTDGFLSQDLSAIYVDQFELEARPNRYRFTLAHELGHRELHADVLEQLQFSDVAGWKEAITEVIPEREYDFMRYQANCFAGLILVPPARLREAFVEAVEFTRSCDVDLGLDIAQDFVANYLANRRFEVSTNVARIRVERDGLWETMGR